VVTLEHMLKEREEGLRDFVLVDVREPNEYEINLIPGSVLIPKGEFLNGNALSQLPSDLQIVLHCKTGVRSAEALAVARKRLGERTGAQFHNFGVDEILGAA